MKNPQTPRAHAVDAPVGVPVVVADGDGEPSIVRPDEVDDGAFSAANLQGLAFTRVRCFISGFWKKEKNL